MDLRVEDADAVDKALEAVDLDQVARRDRLGEQQDHAAEKVFEDVLKRESRRQRSRAQRRDQGGDVHARRSQRRDDHRAVERDADHGKSKGFGGVFALGHFQRLADGDQQQPHHHHADDHDERKPKKVCTPYHRILLKIFPHNILPARVSREPVRACSVR